MGCGDVECPDEGWPHSLGWDENLFSSRLTCCSDVLVGMLCFGGRREANVWGAESHSHRSLPHHPMCARTSKSPFEKHHSKLCMPFFFTCFSCAIACSYTWRESPVISYGSWTSSFDTMILAAGLCGWDLKLALCWIWDWQFFFLISAFNMNFKHVNYI